MTPSGTSTLTLRTSPPSVRCGRGIRMGRRQGGLRQLDTLPAARPHRPAAGRQRQVPRARRDPRRLFTPRRRGNAARFTSYHNVWSHDSAPAAGKRATAPHRQHQIATCLYRAEVTAENEPVVACSPPRDRTTKNLEPKTSIMTFFGTSGANAATARSSRPRGSRRGPICTNSEYDARSPSTTSETM